MCEITVSLPTGQESAPGQGIITLTVSGTAADCSAVLVKVHQTQPVDIHTPQKTAQVSNGQWSVDFTVAAGDFQPGDFLCGRGNKYVIEAECADDSSCKAELADALISCGNCPEVEFTVTPGDCQNGRRTVHVRADVTSANDATYTWFFGTDEDNQPGEDSQSGDGSGNPWLPAPDQTGARIVEVDHVYEPAGDQPQTITVRLVTSSGPDALCTAQTTFALDPCRCDLTVSLEIKDQTGRTFSDRECLPPGDYTVEVVSPTGSGIDYAWSVDGAADSGQTGSAYAFSVSAGEEKSVSVVIIQGGCSASRGVTVTGCDDCSDFEARLQILDRNRRDVTRLRCLPPGDYTVRAVSPTGAGNTFRWSVDNEPVATVTGPTIQITLGDDDRKIVTLEASRGECRDTATVVLETCPPDDDDDDDDDDGNGDGFIPCLLFKVFALLMLAIAILGAVLLACPLAAAPLLPPPVAMIVGGALLAGGLFLMAVFLLLWFLICRPTACDWLSFLWQALIVLGLITIYAGFCPPCVWMQFGVIPLIAGAFLSIVWGRNCDVSRCRVLAEWITLFTFVVNVAAFLEFILAACVITSRPIASVIWGLMIAAMQIWLWYEFNRSDCIQD